MKRPGEYLYLTMSDEPLGPGGSNLGRRWPPYERMGCEIGFSDLPEGCRRLVLETYLDLWGLTRPPERPELAFDRA